MTETAPTPSRLAQLVEAAATVAGQTGLVQVLQTTVETARDGTGARYGALGVLGEHGTVIDFHHVGIDQDVVDKIGRLPEGRGVLGTITRMRKTIRLDDISEHPDAVGFPEHHPPMTTFLGVPVRVGDRVFGNLYLADKDGGFDADDEQFVESLAVIAGSAVATARLHERLRQVALVEDRERIARELHDAVIQDLFAVGLSLQAAAGEAFTDPRGVENRMLEAVDQLDRVIKTLRQYIFDIRRRTWPERDLGLELEELVEQLAAPHDGHVDLELDGEVSSLPHEVVETALQIAREAVNNALQHSGADAVRVTVSGGTHQLVLEVADSGRGFDPASAPPGMGLGNMETRARRAGGVVEVNTEPGAGTTVAIVLPTRRAS